MHADIIGGYLVSCVDGYSYMNNNSKISRIKHFEIVITINWKLMLVGWVGGGMVVTNRTY